MPELTDKEINTLILAALETIRLNQYEVVNLQVKKEGSLNTTLETLLSKRFDPGYIYLIQAISCVEIGTGTPQVKIGLYESPTRFLFESGTVNNAEDSIEYVGQLLVGEHDQIYADFENCVAGDTIYMNINGYRIRR